MNTLTATRLQAADVNITMVSNTQAVTDYARRYFGSWWNAFEVPPASVCAAPVVFADVDEDQYATLQALVETCPHEETTYAKAATLVARDAEGTITAVSPTQQLAYRHEPSTGRLSVIGAESGPVALAAARIARDALRGLLLRDGWTLLHASAVTDNCRTVLAFGEKGAGKTTTALALANMGWQLLANDRIFVRPDDKGQLQVLPWPSAAAIGLGLLDALGWHDVARKRLEAGEALHPTQHPDVTDAVLAGRREPPWEPDGKRERKVQVYPDQFADWFRPQAGHQRPRPGRAVPTDPAGRHPSRRRMPPHARGRRLHARRDRGPLPRHPRPRPGRRKRQQRRPPERRPLPRQAAPPHRGPRPRPGGQRRLPPPAAQRVTPSPPPGADLPAPGGTHPTDSKSLRRRGAGEGGHKALAAEQALTPCPFNHTGRVEAVMASFGPAQDLMAATDLQSVVSWGLTSHDPCGMPTA
ncbi:hypothetical protein ACRAWF_30040 [Streptomyces sp. L7]